MRDEKRNFPGIESLRGICSILVFLAHCGGFIPSFGLWGGGSSLNVFCSIGFLKWASLSEKECHYIAGNMGNATK